MVLNLDEVKTCFLIFSQLGLLACPTVALSICLISEGEYFSLSQNSVLEFESSFLKLIIFSVGVKTVNIGVGSDLSTSMTAVKTHALGHISLRPPKKLSGNGNVGSDRPVSEVVGSDRPVSEVVGSDRPVSEVVWPVEVDGPQSADRPVSPVSVGPLTLLVTDLKSKGFLFILKVQVFWTHSTLKPKSLNIIQ